MELLTWGYLGESSCISIFSNENKYFQQYMPVVAN